MSIVVIYGSTRPDGNTEQLTKYAIEGLEVEQIYLRDYKIEPIEDRRHSEGGFSDVGDDYNGIVERMMKHDTFIFATPIYWYSMTGTMKNFIDRWSHTMRDEKFPGFKDQLGTKKAYVIAVGGDNPHVKGLPLIQQFNYIFEFMSISFEGYVLGKASRPGDVSTDSRAHSAATAMNQKLKE
ncbi:flavodoxin family protein [Paenisporosarcina quisquiliarum]|uniref:Flavodoxin family protein n=1 Tax=Paenisporosarcina quisquiliarum TaxID=365346 RepID=A0A9X3LI93_9BACL|nr:flavodoxin family protein [Paenisporosarcina quisquiliarum]MCZ8538242.1 flavodoxin family protein [Paenisporosarcina quisquiliarum]